jgi:hypothetical protein
MARCGVALAASELCYVLDTCRRAQVLSLTRYAARNCIASPSALLQPCVRHPVKNEEDQLLRCRNDEFTVLS